MESLFGVFEASWGAFWASRGSLGSLLEPLGAILGRSWGDLGRPRGGQTVCGPAVFVRSGASREISSRSTDAEESRRSELPGDLQHASRASPGAADLERAAREDRRPQQVVKEEVRRRACAIAAKFDRTTWEGDFLTTRLCLTGRLWRRPRGTALVLHWP